MITNESVLKLRFCLSHILIGILCEDVSAKTPKPASVVDYMKSIGLDSNFDHRKKLFLEK